MGGMNARRSSAQTVFIACELPMVRSTPATPVAMKANVAYSSLNARASAPALHRRWLGAAERPCALAADHDVPRVRPTSARARTSGVLPSGHGHDVLLQAVRSVHLRMGSGHPDLGSPRAPVHQSADEDVDLTTLERRDEPVLAADQPVGAGAERLGPPGDDIHLEARRGVRRRVGPRRWCLTPTCSGT